MFCNKYISCPRNENSSKMNDEGYYYCNPVNNDKKKMKNERQDYE